MTRNLRCTWRGCLNEGTENRIDGAPYCREHYRLELENRYFDAYNGWDGNPEPGEHFRYWFSRYFEFLHERRELTVPNLITRARIRDRGYEFKKTERGVEFSIIRHPYAWSEKKIPYEEKQRWCVDFGAKTVRVSLPRDSIQNDKVICLECGSEMRQLTKKHLVSHGMNQKDYRKKYGLTMRTPLEAKSLTEARRKAAKERGLPEKLQ